MTDLKTDDLKEIIAGYENPVFVDFWAEWCGPCRMITPVVEELAKEYGDKITFIKVNVDQNPQSAAAYGVRSIPTLFVFDKGAVVEKQTGAVPKNKIVDMLQPFL